MKHYINKPAFPEARGFTLVEVLMAMFILAIGLISLAAVFPSGIELQRQGADDLQAVALSDEVFSLLVGDPQLNSNRLNEGFTGMLAPGNRFGRGETDWMTGRDRQNPSSPATEGPMLLDTVGNLSLTVLFDPNNPLMPKGTPDDTVTFTIADRLWPSAENPHFIWDLVIRRPDARRTGVGSLPLAAQMQSRVQIAVIVRRVDNGYKYDPNNPQPPIRDRNGIYIPPRVSDPNHGYIRYRGENFPEDERFEWVGNDPDLLKAYDQPRQKLLDTEGNIWRIARFREKNGTTFVQFAPEPTVVMSSLLAGSAADSMPFVYTDKVPLIIRVITFGADAGIPSHFSTRLNDDVISGL